MSDADTSALVAMLRQIQCEPASFDTYSMASAAERAADAIERLRSSGGASGGHVTGTGGESPSGVLTPVKSPGEPGGQPPAFYRLQRKGDAYDACMYPASEFDLVIVPQPPTKEVKP